MENDVAQRWRGHYRRGPPGKGSVEGGVRGKADLAADLPPVVSPPICRREQPSGLPFRPRPPSSRADRRGCPGSGGDPVVHMKSHHPILWDWLAGGLRGHCPPVKALTGINEQVIMSLVS